MPFAKNTGTAKRSPSVTSPTQKKRRNGGMQTRRCNDSNIPKGNTIKKAVLYTLPALVGFAAAFKTAAITYDTVRDYIKGKLGVTPPPKVIKELVSNLREGNRTANIATSQKAAEKGFYALSTDIIAKQNKTANTTSANKNRLIAQKAIIQLPSNIEDSKQNAAAKVTSADKVWKSMPKYTPPGFVKYSSFLFPVRVSRNTVYRQIKSLKTLHDVKMWQKEHLLPYRALSSPGWARGMLYGAMGLAAVSGGLIGYHSRKRGGGTYNDTALNHKLICLVDPLDIHMWFQESSRWIGLELLMRPALVYRCLVYISAVGVTGGVVVGNGVKTTADQGHAQEKDNASDNHYRNIIEVAFKNNPNVDVALRCWDEASLLNDQMHHNNDQFQMVDL
jgi:hypothetical protein